MVKFKDERLKLLNREDRFADEGMRKALVEALEEGESARAAYSVSMHIWVEAVLTDRALLLVKGALKARVIRMPLPVELLRTPGGIREGARIRTPLGDKTLWSSKLDPQMGQLLAVGVPAGAAAEPVPSAAPSPQRAISQPAGSVGGRTARRILTIFGIVGAVVLASTFFFASSGQAATKVVRIIDGDTLVVDIDGDRERVRILSIDTPETKDPDQPVECLGPEAAAFLKELLPVGTEVELDYDTTRRDRYGRLLAAVFTPDGESAAEALAAAGLGVPIQVGANSKYYRGVKAALSEAQVARRGFFDPGEDCTLPAQQGATVNALTTAAAAPPVSTTGQATSRIAQLVAAVAAGKALLATLEAPGKSLAFTALPAAQVNRMRLELQRALAQADTRVARLRERRNELAAEIRQAREERRREADEKKRREREEREQWEAAAEDDDNHYSGGGSTGGGGNPYPGYNGPRCYEPGGLVWHPC